LKEEGIMNLIIRVTGKCNFDCTFCSAGSLNIMHPINGVPDQIKDVIETIRPSTIIISGGEPLLVGPDYYYELLEISNKYHKCGISITSNLKEFYYHPDDWVDLFKNDQIGVVTSFNYGYSRRWDKNTVYNDKKFIEIFNLFKEKVGKTPMFIAVIDRSNEDTVLQTVKLAKELGTYVRLNNATKQGRCGSTYPRYKIFQKYIEIMEAGYEDYELYCRGRDFISCPMNAQFLCKSSIRTCYVDTNNVLHYYDCCESEVEHLLDYHNDSNRIQCSEYPSINEHVTKKCITCELFPLCNGCASQRSQYPPEHCAEMQKLKPKLIQYGWVK
jgi:sulfatase maturation enzyme AslB (radical SAM superfamily)